MNDRPINQIIEQALPTLTKAQKTVALSIMAEPMYTAFAPIKNLSEKIGVSTATIVRFAYALGYKGYGEMQQQLLKYCQQRQHPVERLDNHFSKSTSTSGILSDILEQQIQNMRLTFGFDFESKMEATLNLLKNAEHIYTCGSRGSHSISYFLGHHLNRVFRNCDILEENNRLPDYLARMTSRDVFFVVSQPRYGRQLVRATYAAKKNGVKIISITDGPDSALVEPSNVVFFARNESHDFHNSMVAAMLIAESIISMIISGKFVNARQNLSELEPYFDSMRTFY